METADKKCDYYLKPGFSSRLAICFIRKSWNMKSGDLRYLASYGANTLIVIRTEIKCLCQMKYIVAI
jgi:hypothetical protein